METGEKGQGHDRSGNVCPHSIGPGGFELKRLLRRLLASPDFEEALERLDVPPHRVINPLLCFLYETGETLRWRAVRGVGIIVAAMAEKEMEAARVIMRRFLWNLNDESGGIGWGIPEAMGEVMAENGMLAGEYYRILLSYIDENGNPLENDELQRGAMWGINRLAQKRPELLREWTGPVLAQLKSPDRVKRGLALLTLLLVVEKFRGAVDTERVEALVVPLLEDQTQIRIFQNGAFVEHEIACLASQLLFKLKDFSLSRNSFP